MKIIFSLIVVIALGTLGYFAMQIAKPNSGEQTASVKAPINNVSLSNGQQVVEIKAKGGYFPRVSTAKAGVPTVLKINTQGTFDCSSQVRIPSMNISKSLPPSGVTEIALGTLEEGVVQGTCGMGMYPFEINVQS
jgi:plastocyanin domain-containing protein